MVEPTLKLWPWKNGEVLQTPSEDLRVDLEECIGVFECPAE